MHYVPLYKYGSRTSVNKQVLSFMSDIVAEFIHWTALHSDYFYHTQGLSVDIRAPFL